MIKKQAQSHPATTIFKQLQAILSNAANAQYYKQYWNDINHLHTYIETHHLIPAKLINKDFTDLWASLIQITQKQNITTAEYLDLARQIDSWLFQMILYLQEPIQSQINLIQKRLLRFFRPA